MHYDEIMADDKGVGAWTAKIVRESLNVEVPEIDIFSANMAFVMWKIAHLPQKRPRNFSNGSHSSEQPITAGSMISRLT